MNAGWNQHQLICRYKETIDKILAESWQKIEVRYVVMGVITNQWWIQRLRKMKPWRLIWWTTTRTKSSSLTQSLTQIFTRLVSFSVQKLYLLQNVFQNWPYSISDIVYKYIFKALVQRGERRFSHKALLGALMICMYRQGYLSSLSLSFSVVV